MNDRAYTAGESPVTAPSRGRLLMTALVAITLLLAFMAAGYLWWALPQTQILRIALIGPMSGPQADIGLAMERGTRLYLEHLRAERGSAVDIELEVFDDHDDPEIARDIAWRIAKRDDIALVVGHYSSGVAVSAGRIYRDVGIPTITGSATANNVTSNNDWYFSLLPADRYQGAMIAAYMSSVLDVKGVTIVHGGDDYGVSLARGFEEAATPLGIKILDKLTFGTKGDTLDRNLEKVAQTISAADEPGMIFLATQPKEGVKLITSLYGHGLSFFGPASFSGEDFRAELLSYPQERVQPGYYVDGVYATLPLLLGAAQRQAHEFYYAYQDRYHQDPNWVAAAYFDAASLAVQALEHAAGAENQRSGHEIRSEARRFLANLNRPEKMNFGVTGEIQFDTNGSAVRPLAVGIFHGHRLVSAPVQFQLVRDERRIDNMLKEILEGRILFVNRQFMHRTQVVYTGIDINEVRNFDIDDSSFLADFYIWFRSEKDFDVSQIEFLNSAAPVLLEQPVVESDASGLYVKAYRVRAQFRGEFDFYRFPFDEQELPIQLRHAYLTRDRLIFVPDTLGMRDTEMGDRGIKPLATPTISGWRMKRMQFFQDEIHNTSSFGVPAFFDSRFSMDYSRFNATARIARDAGSYILKNLFPMIFVVLLSYVVFFISEFKVRMSTAASALLTTAFFHLKLSAGIPVTYLVAIEYYFYAIYALIGLSLSATIAFHRLETLQKTDPQRSDWAKETSRRMDIAGRWGYPLLVVSVSAWIWHSFSTA